MKTLGQVMKLRAEQLLAGKVAARSVWVSGPVTSSRLACYSVLLRGIVPYALYPYLRAHTKGEAGPMQVSALRAAPRS